MKTKISHIYASVISATVIFVIALLLFVAINVFDAGELFKVIAVLAFTLCILGGVILFQARSQKRPFKTWLQIMGISAICTLAGAILHNVFYALGIAFPDFAPFFSLFEGAFFLLSIPIASVIFIVAAVMSVKNLFKMNT
jgi:hypothetical protein